MAGVPTIEAVKFVLMVQEMDRARAFYRDVLGLREVLHTPLWSELAHGDAIVALHAGGGEGYRGTGLSFQVEDIQAACDAAVAGGATLRRGPEHRPGDPVKLAELADPEGNGFLLSESVL